MRVMAILTIAVVDRNVIAEGMMPMVLPKAEIMRIRDPALHRYYTASRPRRYVESVQTVAPMRKGAVRPLRHHPRFAGRHRKFVARGRDHERHRTAQSLVHILDNHQIFVG